MKMIKKNRDSEHEFTLVLTGIHQLTEEIEDALFEACDDATLAMRSGRPFLTFSRAAASVKDAILGAIGNVSKAGIGAGVLRVEYCNLVTQADIARKIGRSRQLIHQYISGVRGPGGFPPPVCEIFDSQSVWSWCEVARWLWENNMVKEQVLRDAEEVEVINAVLDFEHQKRSRPGLTREVRKSVAAR